MNLLQLPLVGSGTAQKGGHFLDIITFFGAALLGFFGDLLLGRVFLDMGAVLAIAFVGSRIVYFLYEQQNQDGDKDDPAP